MALRYIFNSTKAIRHDSIIRVFSRCYSKINAEIKQVKAKDCIPHSYERATTGAIVGVHVSNEGKLCELSETAHQLNNYTGGRLLENLHSTLPYPSVGEARVFHGLDPFYRSIAVVGLGNKCLGYSPIEQIDERKEVIRTAAATGIRALSDIYFEKVFVESFGHAESAAEGAAMAAWKFQENRNRSKQKIKPRLELLDNSDDTARWEVGLHNAAAQNLARHLAEKPGNNLTPRRFVQTAVELLSRYSINIEVRMPHWAKLSNLNAFLAAGSGSHDPPIFLELSYEGTSHNEQPVMLIGKGVTFNSGGLFLKGTPSMKYMRGDMSGAACVLATIRAIAALRLPINVRTLIPLCESKACCSALKPGDVINAHNGKTILVENPNCEGLLMHADALSYAGKYNPKMIVDVGTLAPDMIGAMGDSACGVFTNNESLYETARIASIHTGDRIWRLPLWNYFTEYMMDSSVSDLTNKTPKMIGGGACKAAAFLREFVPPDTDWIHMDICNTYRTNGTDFKYLHQGMSGRPTRTLIEFLAQLCVNNC